MLNCLFETYQRNRFSKLTPHIHTQILYEVMDVLASFTVVIILQYILISNNFTVYLSLHNVTCQLCFNKLEKTLTSLFPFTPKLKNWKKKVMHMYWKKKTIIRQKLVQFPLYSRLSPSNHHHLPLMQSSVKLDNAHKWKILLFNIWWKIEQPKKKMTRG